MPEPIVPAPIIPTFIVCPPYIILFIFLHALHKKCPILMDLLLQLAVLERLFYLLLVLVEEECHTILLVFSLKAVAK